MSGNTHCGSRYARLVAAFAVCAFVLLSLLTFQQQVTNSDVTATVRYSTDLPKSVREKNCAMKEGTRGTQTIRYWLCRIR